MTFDCIAYDDLEEGLMAETQYPPGEIRDSAIDTLAELRRRYAERQERKE
ncbi:MAG: hypothetical protein LBM28_02145 [Oscillospiraceae bacterium]|nr:hypothetical protein [Oscillospiraceae bacterium]